MQRVLRKVNKRKVKGDVAALVDVIKLLKQIEKKVKGRFGYSNGDSITQYCIHMQIEQAEELHARYSKQLVCDHQDTDTIETVNGHTGVHDFEVVCNTCKFILDSY